MRFWNNQSWYQVCRICSEGNPMTALLVLARRRPGAVQFVQRWLAESLGEQAV
jgi:hypothetical protein